MPIGPHIILTTTAIIHVHFFCKQESDEHAHYQRVHFFNPLKICKSTDEIMSAVEFFIRAIFAAANYHLVSTLSSAEYTGVLPACFQYPQGRSCVGRGIGEDPEPIDQAIFD